MKNPMRGSTIAPGLHSGEIASTQRDHAHTGDQFIVGITKLAPSFTPEGQREVTVLVFV